MIRKLTAHGWAYIKGTLLCPTCNENRKAAAAAAKQEKITMAPNTQSAPPPLAVGIGGINLANLRRPTREQDRQILELLTEFYDKEVGRYRGAETDKALADVIGGGCMPGWVAEVRERFFGADGGNENIEGLRAEIKDWLSAMAKLEAEVRAMQEKAQRAVTEKLTALALEYQRGEGYAKALESIRAAVGPKAEKVRL